MEGTTRHAITAPMFGSKIGPRGQNTQNGSKTFALLDTLFSRHHKLFATHRRTASFARSHFSSRLSLRPDQVPPTSFTKLTQFVSMEIPAISDSLSTCTRSSHSTKKNSPSSKQMHAYLASSTRFSLPGLHWVTISSQRIVLRGGSFCDRKDQFHHGYSAHEKVEQQGGGRIHYVKCGAVVEGRRQNSPRAGGRRFSFGSGAGKGSLHR